MHLHTSSREHHNDIKIISILHIRRDVYVKKNMCIKGDIRVQRLDFVIFNAKSRALLGPINKISKNTRD